MGPTNWTDSIAVTRLGEHRFRAQVDEQWTSLQGVHGGVVVAIAINAASTVLRHVGLRQRQHRRRSHGRHRHHPTRPRDDHHPRTNHPERRPRSRPRTPAGGPSSGGRRRRRHRAAPPQPVVRRSGRAFGDIRERADRRENRRSALASHSLSAGRARPAARSGDACSCSVRDGGHSPDVVRSRGLTTARRLALSNGDFSTGCLCPLDSGARLKSSRLAPVGELDGHRKLELVVTLIFEDLSVERGTDLPAGLVGLAQEERRRPNRAG
jgi:hypothetical protein